MGKIAEVNGREMNQLEWLEHFHYEMVIAEKVLEKRLKSVPDAWRRFRACRGMLKNVIKEVEDTLPPDKQNKLVRDVVNCELVIKVKSVASEKFETVVKTDDLKTIVETAIGYECGMCLKEGSDIKHCPLRKALRGVSTPNDIGNGTCCEYAHYYEERSKDNETD